MLEALESIDSLFGFLLAIALPRVMVYCGKIPLNREISPLVASGENNIYLRENFTEATGQTTSNYSTSQSSYKPDKDVMGVLVDLNICL